MRSTAAFDRTAFSFAFLSCLVSLSLVMPFSARADAACGPGQRMVGMRYVDGGPVGQPRPQIPACAPDGSQVNAAVAAAPETVLLPLNAAIIWANLADGRPVYFYTRQRLSAIGAVEDAVRACESFGALNCRPGLTAAGGWLAVSRSGDGSLYAAYGAKKKQAEKAALARCGQDAKDCAVAESIRNN